ncbi:MAG: DUF1501 domain-containing protein [Planctomycetota bacterium]|nr:MAG: DUF1501 domain-containing protein [Planctomycetota bacterium]
MPGNRRRCLKTIIGMGAAVGAPLTWQSQLAAQLQAARSSRRLIVLWMPGGPSQMDTWDLKPGHSNGGPFQERQTSVPGIRISEHLPQLAKWVHRMAIIRSMQTKEGDHSRGTFLVRTGQRPGQPIHFPAFPAVLAKELMRPSSGIPGYVSILPSSFISPRAFGAGFLGPAYQPLTVGRSAGSPIGATEQADTTDPVPVDLRVENLQPPAGFPAYRIRRRREFWELLQSSYAPAQRAGPAIVHDTVYRRAMQLAESDLVDAFDLSREDAATRQEYGPQAFGQGCLLARRLIQRGVPVVEVALDEQVNGLSWDTHADNFNAVRRLSQILDRGWSRLMQDLSDCGLLEETTIAWMGEFGRTPTINAMAGRDHFPNAWSCVLAGGGVAGGVTVGATSEDGMEVIDRPVSAPELLATISAAVGIDPSTENYNSDGRPFKIADASPVAAALAST